MPVELLEAQGRGRITPAERRAFAAKIRRLIDETGDLEKQKVEAAIRLLRDAQDDIQRRLRRLPKDAEFSRTTARMVKAEVERQLADFEKAGADLLAGSAEEAGQLGLRYTRELSDSQGLKPRPLRLPREIVFNAAERTADLIRSLSSDQIGDASNIINRGILTGRSAFDVARDLDRAFDKGLARMETIARTEMLMVYSQAQQAQYNDIGERMPGLRKQWIAVTDSRTRPEHEDAHLDIVGWDEDFTVGGEKLSFPRDPKASVWNIANCRCTSIPVLPEGGEPMTGEELPPVRAPLGGLAAKVSAEVRKSGPGRPA